MSSRGVAIPDDRIGSTESLAQFASDLTDAEIKQVGRIVTELVGKYGRMANTPEVLEQLRDEALTRMAEIGVLATLDPAPVFYGEPPTVEIIGKIAGDPIYQYGMDHEKKRWEVLKSRERGEDYLGQKEATDMKSKAAKDRGRKR